MKTLTSPITAQRDSTQSGWCELYDFYLKSPITTPFGVTNILRLTNNPAGFNFFTPKVSPESAGTQGAVQAYSFWPLKRQLIKGSNKFTNDKLAIAASNVSTEWAQMLSDVDWEAVPVVIRKVSTTIASPTADDCALIFSGSIDSVKVTREILTFTVSNDFGTFNVLAPRENMHANCRFNWGDDQCTMIRYLAANYKTKTVGSGSTTINVKSADLTEDTGSKGNYGTDLVDALPDASITSSSEDGAIAGAEVAFIYMVQTKTGIIWSYFHFTNSNNTLPTNAPVKFTGTLPTGMTAGTTYYVKDYSANLGYRFSTTPGGPAYGVMNNGSGTITLDTVAITFSAYQVKNSYPASFWKFQSASDWGSNSQGYWTITNGSGLHSSGLTPWIQFDFGAGFSGAPRLWRLCGRQDSDREELPRLLQFHSSTSSTFASGNTFEGYFVCPPRFGSVSSPQLFDVLLPNASSSKRYWRICVRSRWSDTLRYSLLYKVYAYAGSRHYWQDGQITFAGNITPALRNVSRAIRESYSGELICAPLPVAPASGDTFAIERGCARTFSAPGRHPSREGCNRICR